jgi:hypothetical protein
LNPVCANDPRELKPACRKLWSYDPLCARRSGTLYGLFKHVSVAFDGARDHGDVKQSHSTYLHLGNDCIDQLEVLDYEHFFLNPPGRYK